MRCSVESFAEQFIADVKTLVSTFLRLFKLILIMSGAIVLTGCSKAIDFQEDVLMSDGAKMEINRVERLRLVCQELSCGWALDRSEIRMSGSTSKAWENRLVPLLLDKYEGKYFLVATTIYCNDPVFGHPNPDYIQFELSESGWKRTELKPYIFGRQANLLIAPDWNAGEPKKIDVSTKETRNKGAGVKSYKKIFTPITPNNC